MCDLQMSYLLIFDINIISNVLCLQVEFQMKNLLVQIWLHTQRRHLHELYDGYMS